MKKKSYTWPSKDELREVLPILEKAEGSRGLHPQATMVERIKYDLCEQLVGYKLRNDITQKEMADKLAIDPALMSKILRYRFDEFTIDRLVRYLEILDIKVTLKAA